MFDRSLDTSPLGQPKDHPHTRQDRGADHITPVTGQPDRPERAANRIPLGRPGEPDEVAAAITWLLSPDASYSTGAILRVGGGL